MSLARHTLAIAKKEALHFARDPQAIALALVMPLLFVVLFGVAMSFDADHIRIAVADQDHSQASRQWVRALAATDQWLVTPVDSPAAVEEALRRGRARAGLVIGAGFSRQLLRGETVPIQLLVDGADTTTAQLSIGYLVAHAQAQALAGQALPLTVRARMVFNPRMLSAWFIVPGVVAVVLAILAVLLSALTVAREWERGSMEQLFSTPVGRLAVMLGKLLPYVVLGLMQLLLVVCAGRWLFDVPLVGSLGAIMVATALFLACALGQGLLISTITKSQQVATQIGMISALLPSILLSGFVFPVENMPLPLRVISHIVPARWFIPILRGQMLGGRGMAELWPHYLGLTVLAFVLVGLATAKFKRSLE